MTFRACPALAATNLQLQVPTRWVNTPLHDRCLRYYFHSVDDFPLLIATSETCPLLVDSQTTSEHSSSKCNRVLSFRVPDRSHVGRLEELVLWNGSHLGVVNSYCSVALVNARGTVAGLMVVHSRLGGVPIVVVCTKADLVDENNELAVGPLGMGKGKGSESEERTDTVVQVLRTICLKCKNRKLISRCYFFYRSNRYYLDGAAILYTTPLLATLQVHRQYALHILFTSPAPPPGVVSGSDAVARPEPFPIPT
jgi:hypothetical protein